MEIPEIPIADVPSPTSIDLEDDDNEYPLLETVQGPPAADSVGPLAANRQARALDRRTEKLRTTVNLIVSALNSLSSNLLHRDGASATVDGDLAPSFMRGNLDMGDDPTAPVLHKVINLANGTNPTDGVNKGQLDAVQTFLNGLLTQLSGCLKVNGTNAMTAALNMGGNRIEFVGTPVNVSDAVTKGYADTALALIMANYLSRDGSQPMTGDLNMGGNKVTNLDLGVPSVDGDGVSRAYLLQVLSEIAATPPGTIAPFAGDEVSIPTGWLLCDGRAVSRTDFAALFAVVGVVYGAGNGSTTFNLPDFRGRVAVGLDNMGSLGAANRITDPQADALGGTFGAQSHVLGVNELPVHSHSYVDSYVTDEAGGDDLGPVNTNMTSEYTSVSRTTGTAGAADAHGNIQPSIAMNVIVKT